MAHVKGTGTTSLGRDSKGQRLGVKLFAGQKTNAGGIIIRQHGTKFHPGKNVRRGHDDTLFATIAGVVTFSKRSIKQQNGTRRTKQYVNVIPA
ncbi:MAG: 50S ribosomal protein L27 [Patescibacteria group bacterium]|jgi:large subunit ribosomal protein L27